MSGMTAKSYQDVIPERMRTVAADIDQRQTWMYGSISPINQISTLIHAVRLVKVPRTTPACLVLIALHVVTKANEHGKLESIAKRACSCT